MEWEGAGLKLAFGPWERSASPCIHVCSHPARSRDASVGFARGSHTGLCSGLGVLVSMVDPHFLHVVHKPVEYEEHRAVSGPQHLTFQEKLKHPKMVMMNVLRKN